MKNLLFQVYLHFTKQFSWLPAFTSFHIFTCKNLLKNVCGCEAILEKCESFSPADNKQYTVSPYRIVGFF